MSDVTAITLGDGQATPVNHTFDPVEVAPHVVFYEDKSASSVLGRPTLSIGQRRPNGANGNRKVTLRVRVPVLEEVGTSSSGYTPGPSIAYSVLADMSFVLPSRATTAEINDIFAYAKNLMSHASIDEVVTDDDFPY